MILEIRWIKSGLDGNLVISINVFFELDWLFCVCADAVELVAVDSVETIIAILIIVCVLRFGSFE